MMIDDLMASERGSFHVAEFARGRRVEEVNNEVGRTIYGLYVTWAWHLHRNRYSQNAEVRNHAIVYE